MTTFKCNEFRKNSYTNEVREVLNIGAEKTSLGCRITLGPVSNSIVVSELIALGVWETYTRVPNDERLLVQPIELPPDIRTKKAKKARKKTVSVEEILACAEFQTLDDLLWEKEGRGVKTSSYSFNEKTRDRAEHLASRFGLDLHSLELCGMAKEDTSPISLKHFGKALAPKGTVTFISDVFSEEDIIKLRALERKFRTRIAQKPDSPWGGDKVTLNWDWFWFSHIRRGIELGHIKMLDTLATSV
jgi:hypothetical protein